MKDLQEKDKMDILTALQEAGVDFLVIQILQMLSLPDLCSLFQVSSAWNTWDSSYLWNKVLSSLLKDREELTEFLKHSKSEKESAQILWRLGQAWRHSDCCTVRVCLESSVLSVVNTGVSVLCGMNSGEVEEWSMEGVKIRSKEMHEKGIRVLKVDKTNLLTGSYDGTVKIWCGDWYHLKTILVGVAVTDLCIFGRYFLLCGGEGRVECYQDIKDKAAMLWRVEGGEMVNGVVVWGEVLVTGRDDGELLARDMLTGSVVSSMVENGHQRGCGVSGLAVGHLGLWSASFDCSVRLWGSQYECLAVLTGHTNPVGCIAVDRSRLVSGDYRGFVMIWDMKDIEQELATFKKKKKTLKKDKGEGIYFLRSKRVVKNTTGIAEVLQHNSILQHNGNVTELALDCGTLISASRDRTFNIHKFSADKKKPTMMRKSYL